MARRIASRCSQWFMFTIFIAELVFVVYLFGNRDVARRVRAEGLIVVFFACIFLSLLYTVLMMNVNYRLHWKGGFFARYDSDTYSAVMCLFWTLTIIWTLLGVLSFLLSSSRYVPSIGMFLFADALLTAVIPLSLRREKRKYYDFIEQIQFEGQASGQPLSDSEAHHVYKLRQNRELLLETKAGRDRWGRKLDEGRLRALQLDDFFFLQKLATQLRGATAIGGGEATSNDAAAKEATATLQRSLALIDARCQGYALSDEERRHFRELARRECALEAGAMLGGASPSWTMLAVPSSKRGDHGGVETRCSSTDAPPSYHSRDSWANQSTGVGMLLPVLAPQCFGGVGLGGFGGGGFG